MFHLDPSGAIRMPIMVLERMADYFSMFLFSEILAILVASAAANCRTDQSSSPCGGIVNGGSFSRRNQCRAKVICSLDIARAIYGCVK